MDYEYDYNDFPLAYLITLRTYGTWLHGDQKRSIDRHGFNIYGTPRRDENKKLEETMLSELKHKSFLMNEVQRQAVKSAIIEVCEYRKYELQAINIRSNHLHAVVSAQTKPALIADAFKSYATRSLRKNFLIDTDTKVWARGRSRRYLWKPRHVSLAVEYVLYGQGDILSELTDCPEIDD